jgi:hypothetical protein
VAACNAEGSIFTAPEIFADGTAEVRMTLTRPRDMGALVIRQVGAAKDVRVTILEIGMFEASEERLAPRRNDLGYDLFVILSAPKTGTHTMGWALKSLSPSVRVHRVHCASAEGTARLRALGSAAGAALGAEHDELKSLNLQAEAGDLARAEIAMVRRLGGRVAFLTAVREPIGRAVARMFGVTTTPVYLHLYASSGPVFAEMLATDQLAAWERELTEALPLSTKYTFWTKCLIDADYMNNEFRAVTGFDLLLHQFDAHQGYAKIEQGNDVAVVFRTSALGRALPSGLAEITGHSPQDLTNRNVAAETEYAALYRDVVSRMRVPSDLAVAIYRRHAYMTHFFDKIEIDELVRRWSRQYSTTTSTLRARRAAGVAHLRKARLQNA